MDDLDDFLNDISTSSTASVSVVPPVVGTTSIIPIAGDDDLDDFLNDITGASGIASVSEVPPAAGTTPTNPLAGDADLDDFLNEITNTPVANNNQQKAGNVDILANDSNFLSWLEDDTDIAAVDSSIHSCSIMPSTSASNLSVTPSGSVDNMLSDIYGSRPKTKTALEEAVDILDSSFPDSERLRQILLNISYVPMSLRSKIWGVLLNGSCAEDSLVAQSKHQYDVNTARIEAHGRALLQHTSSSDTLMFDEFCSILSLFCSRRGFQYSSEYHVFGLLLASLLEMTRTKDDSLYSRGLTASCYDTLSTDFFPLIQTPHDAWSEVSCMVHKLLTYHMPELASHLDALMPMWEQVVVDGSGENDTQANCCVSSSWINTMFARCVPSYCSCIFWDYAILTHERYLGIYLTVTLFFLYSDSLLELVDASSLKEWISSICLVEGMPWFRKIGINVIHAGHPVSFSSDVGVSVDGDARHQQERQAWLRFTNGWLYATIALMKNTPCSATDFINTLEEKRVTAPSRSGDVRRGGDDDNNRIPKGAQNSGAPMVGGRVGAVEDASAAGVWSSWGKTLVSQMSTVVTADPFPATATAADEETANGDKDAYHSQLYQSICLHTHCAEVISSICSNNRPADPAQDITKQYYEGVSNSNSLFSATPSALDSILDSSSSTPAARGGEGCCFPSVCFPMEPSKFFYFGIDCRSENEKVLGKFPKTYDLNVDMIINSMNKDRNSSDEPAGYDHLDTIANLLETLGPLAESAHLCLIGCGDRHFKETDSLGTEFTSSHAKLLYVAQFFLGRFFRHVSILEGGFTSALRFLKKDDVGYQLNSVLVDVNESFLLSFINDSKSLLDVERPLPGQDSAIPFFSPATLFTTTRPIWRDGARASEKGATPTGTASNNAQQIFGAIGKRLSVLGENIKLKAGDLVATPTVDQSVQGIRSSESPHGSNMNGTSARGEDNSISNSRSGTPVATPSAFVIDDDEYDCDDGGLTTADTAMGDNAKISISKTDQEKSLALTMHLLAGLCAGDSLNITKRALPGAVLFPALYYPKTSASEGLGGDVMTSEEEKGKAIGSHRFLVVTPERLLVVDSGGGGVGSTATVKGNHHLTELIKVSYKKKDMDLVKLVLVASLAAATVESDYMLSTNPQDPTAPPATMTLEYRVVKRKELIELLMVLIS